MFQPGSGPKESHMGNHSTFWYGITICSTVIALAGPYRGWLRVRWLLLHQVYQLDGPLSLRYYPLLLGFVPGIIQFTRNLLIFLILDVRHWLRK